MSARALDGHGATMSGAIFRWALWRSVLLAALLASATALPARADDPLDDDAYAAWVGDHAERVLLAMQLPPEFTLGDLRDLAANLDDLIDEARAVEPPPRFAAAHDAYLAAMDAVARTRDALQTVVLTRRPAPELRGALADAGEQLALALRALRDSGVALPGYLLGLVALTDEPGDELGLGLPLAGPGPEDDTTPGSMVSEPAPAQPAVPSAASGLVAPVRPVAADPCAGVRGCAASPRLRVRVLSFGPVLLAPEAGAGRGRQSADGAGGRRGPNLVALRVQVENRGADSYVLRPGMLSVANAAGSHGRLVHIVGAHSLVPQDGLRLAPGESRDGMIFFSLAPPDPRAFIVHDGAASGGLLSVTLP